MQIGKTKINQDAVRNGVWTKFVLALPDGDQELELKIALSDLNVNTAYKDALRTALDPFERLMARYKKGSDIRKEDAEKINKIGKQVFCEQIIQDWKGPKKDDGSDEPYSAARCLELFEEFPELFAEVEKEAGRYERFRTQVLEEASGN